MLNDIKKAHKTELHAHLSGSISTSGLLKLNETKNILTPSELAVLQSCSRSMHNCFDYFYLANKLITRVEDLKLITDDVITQFSQDGVEYLELRTTPKSNFGDHLKHHMIPILEQSRKSAERSRTKVNWILSVDRAKGIQHAYRVLELAIELKESYPEVVGMDFCGHPQVSEFKVFRDVFEKARKNGLKITVHFAETRCAKDNWDILDFGPDRLGHACFVNDSLFLDLLKVKIPIEICLSSNMATADLKDSHAHRVKDYLWANYPIALSTDDSGLFRTNLSQEFFMLANDLDLNTQEIYNLINESFIYRFDTAE